MQVEGLEGLRRASGLAPRQFNVVTRNAVRVSAIQIRNVMLEEVRRFAIGNRFPQSIRYLLSGLSASIGSLAPTAFSIEQGRRPGDVVPIERIRRWVVARGLVRGIFAVGTQQLGGKISSRARRYPGIVRAELAEAARIVELIRRQGTHPKLYGERTLARTKDRVLDNFRDSTRKALHAIAQAGRG